MASRALARRSAEAPRREETNRAALAAVRPAPKARPQAGARARLSRAFVIFVICIAVLAAGRVAMSFAVVQKTVATDAIAREERRISAENARLAEKLATLGSPPRISAIAQSRLGMVQAQGTQYLTVSGSSAAESSSRP